VDGLLAAGSEAAHTAGRVSAEAAPTAAQTAATAARSAATARVSVARVPLVRLGADPVRPVVRAASPLAANGQPSSSPVRGDSLSGQLTQGRARVLTRHRRVIRSLVSRRPLAASPSVRGQSSAPGGLTDTRAWSAPARADTAPLAEVAMPQGSHTSVARAARAAPRPMRSHAHPPFASASRSGVALALSSPPVGATGATGGVASGSGGISAGAGGGALLVLAALWLLRVLLPGRMALDLIPSESALLSLRLERPG
jgi:hypothetical protein